MKLYLAYGSNLNVEQMAFRCPTAERVGTSEIPGKLVFRRGVATVEPSENSETVPVGVWLIGEDDEANLDIYEGYPHFYRKEWITFMLDGEIHKGIIYIMNEGWKIEPPSTFYFETIRKGYKDFGFDISGLLTAAAKCGYYNRFRDDSD